MSGNYICTICKEDGGCDCEDAIILDKKLKKTIILKCNDINNNETLKNLIDRVITSNRYLDFVCENITPLTEACYYGNYDFAEYLIVRGANVNFPDALDNTPLHRACENCHLEIVELLIANGATKNCENAYSDTPKDLASYCNDSEERTKIIERLTKR